MFKSNAPSIKDWFPILKWQKLPNLGNCHSCTTFEHFMQNYYVHQETETLFSNIVVSLSNEINVQNIRLTGEPGAGKTSFLYAFKYMCENADVDDELNKFVMHIIHINQTYDSENIFYEDEANKHIIEAWGKLYTSCNQEKIFTQMTNNTDIKSQKELLNSLSRYYKLNQLQFPKILIIAVDDVDLLEGKHVKHAVEHLLKSIEMNAVKKWLSIRRMTLENYSGQTKKKIEEFFPDSYEFPTIPLKQLLDHRISNTSNGIEPINPFSEVICNDIISPICENNLREGLGLAKTILEDNLPKRIAKNTDQEFITNFLQQASVKSLCKTQKLIDLHSLQYRLTSFPLAIDILGCSEHHTDENIIFGAVSDCCARRNELCHYPIGSKDNIHKLRPIDFNDVIKILGSHNLLYKEGQRLRITQKGIVTLRFASRDYYLNYFKKIHNNAVGVNTYWDLASKRPDHKKAVETFITWNTQRRLNSA